jgi:pilus assembly protein CpaE
VEELRHLCSILVFDAPPLRSDSWAPILGLADEVLLITTPEITAMKRLTAAQEVARARAGKPDHVRVILNRYSEGSGFSVAAISRALGVPIQVVIEDVGPINTYAINHGQPLVSSDRRSAMTRTVIGLAREIGQWNARAGTETKK